MREALFMAKPIHAAQRQFIPIHPYSIFYSPASGNMPLAGEKSAAAAFCRHFAEKPADFARDFVAELSEKR